MTHHQKTLLLNKGYQPICAISWKRALCMYILEKVDILESYDKTVSSPTITFQVPAVIRLKHQAHASPMRVRFSRANIYARDNKTCQYCNNKFKIQELTLDHVIPKSFGGKSAWTNIVTACKDCNTEKANQTPQQAGMRLATRPAYPSVRSLYSGLVGDTIPEEWNNWIFD